MSSYIRLGNLTSREDLAILELTRLLYQVTCRLSQVSEPVRLKIGFVYFIGIDDYCM